LSTLHGEPIARRIEFKLIMAAVVAAAGFWLVIRIAGAGGAGAAEIIASPAYFLGVSMALCASVWAAWLLEMERAGKSGAAFLIVMIAAILFRFLALPESPALSDDIYRYLWDGHVQTRGINPYLYSPDSAALDHVATPYRDLINNPELPTIYPPVSQLVFFASAFLPGGVFSLKVLLILFDLGTVLVLAAILKTRGQSPARVVIYAWSPLAVIEVAWSGHVDPVGVFLLMVASLAFIKGRRRLGWVAGALSGGAKYAGWLAMAPFIRRRNLRSLFLLPVVIGLVYLPYAAAGFGVTGSLFTYAERWRFNDSLFAGILQATEWLHLQDLLRFLATRAGLLDESATWENSLALHLIEPLSIAKGLAALFFLLFAVRVMTRKWEDPVRESFALLAGALLLSPTLHPWYLLWIAPFMAIVPRLSWIWLCGAVLLFSYPDMITRSGDLQPFRWLAWLQYVPFFLILAIESARRRLWERD
jgi:alpha-1,6-mannosyltransferase